MMILGTDQIDVEALMKSAAARAEEMCRELHQNDPEEKPWNDIAQSSRTAR